MLDRDFLRQIQAEEAAGNAKGAEYLRSQHTSFRLAKEAGLIKNELPVENLPTAQKVEPEAPKRNLRKETFELLGKLREPTQEEAEALRSEGRILFKIEPVSLGEFYNAHREYFDYVNSSRTLLDYVPPQAFTVAINQENVRIPGSNNSSQKSQLEQTEKHSKTDIEPRYPSGRAIMLPATAIAQADINYQIENGGKKLIPDYLLRALDTTVVPRVANVGRYRPDDGLDVDGWGRVDGSLYLWVPSAVVFVRE